MVTVFFYLLIFTGSVGRRILIVVPVDTLYRTSIISSSIVLLLNPFANLSLVPLFLFSIYGPDLGVWPDCWVSAEFLRAPIPRKGSGSTTTTTTTTVTARRFLVQFSSFCLLMTSLRIYLGMPMPPCMLTIWPSGPLPQTRSKPPLLSNPPSPS